ncbi:MAG: adenylate/guanylate cyclase domain-containing protein, partial [Psychrosphaera sp.]|nr:adenylate/guanylate cyclase domain-containing protein [Psychrosphaera sp.]
IDKYIGDAIMALFDRSPQDAVSAGINMLKTLENYNRELTKKGIADIRIGIGLNTGPVMIGTLGEANRMESTVISDAVNLAARLEGLTKVYGVSFLISQQTLKQLECPEQFNTRIIDKVTVKGRKEAVLIYEVFDGDPLPMVAGKRTIKAQFEKGWHLYQNMAFEDALTIFKQCQQKYPEDNVTCLYIEKCQTLLSSDLQDPWDGITHID